MATARSLLAQGGGSPSNARAGNSLAVAPIPTVPAAAAAAASSSNAASACVGSTCVGSTLGKELAISESEVHALTLRLAARHAEFFEQLEEAEARHKAQTLLHICPTCLPQFSSISPEDAFEPQCTL